MPKTLDMLAQKGQFHLSSELQAKLASRGFTDIISKSANGESDLVIPPSPQGILQCKSDGDDHREMLQFGTAYGVEI